MKTDEIETIDELNIEVNKLTYDLFGNYNLNTNLEYITFLYIDNETHLNNFLKQWDIDARDDLRRLYYLLNTNHLVAVCCYNLDGSKEWKTMLKNEFDSVKFLKVPYTDNSIASELIDCMNVTEDTPFTSYNYKEKTYEKRGLSFYEINN